MTEEKLKFANNLKARIDKLDKEIDIIAEMEPAVRSAKKFPTDRRGIFRKIIDRKLIYKRPPAFERELELSNEDCRALADIRTAEREALMQVLKSLD